MCFRKSIGTILMIVVMILVAILCNTNGVEATRILLNEDDNIIASSTAANHLLMKYSTIYEKAKHSMGFWLQRLPSGPSPSGPGHQTFVDRLTHEIMHSTSTIYALLLG
ncbi:hypothetical protein I3760_01G168200 [Carya illinoinensis]|nr:hypothetical protein I3760_01G168200 [Carya illinoinensis]